MLLLLLLGSQEIRQQITRNHTHARTHTRGANTRTSGTYSRWPGVGEASGSSSRSRNFTEILFGLRGGDLPLREGLSMLLLLAPLGQALTASPGTFLLLREAQNKNKPKNSSNFLPWRLARPTTPNTLLLRKLALGNRRRRNALTRKTTELTRVPTTEGATLSGGTRNFLEWRRFSGIEIAIETRRQTPDFLRER